MIVDERLEQYGLWSVFHKHLIVELFTNLRDELGDDYWVDMESEIVLVPRPAGPARPVAADVDVTRLGIHRDAPALALATITPALLEVDEPIGEFEQTWIEIRRRDWPDRDDRMGSRIVAVVEVVSPSNKGIFGERDLRKFLAKRRDYLLSTVSYTEIDLLVVGQRELPSAVEKLAEHSLIAWSSQVRECSRHYWAWGWEPNHPLPTIALPLDYPHTCSIDLGACYGQAYQTNRWPDRLELAERQQVL
jgi:hypothetical protein